LLCGSSKIWTMSGLILGMTLSFQVIR